MDFVENGLVLRSADYKEYHKILTVLTPGRGIITVTARNARRKTSQLSAASQIFSFSEMTIYDNRGRYSLTDARVLEQFYGLSADIKAFSAAAYIAEILSNEPEEQQSDSELISLVLNSLYTLSRGMCPPDKVKAVFELRYALISGFSPDFGFCQSCGRELTSALAKYSEGALYCPECSGGEINLTPSCLSAARYVTSCDTKKIFSFELPDETMKRLGVFSESWLLARLERNFKTLDYYKRLK